MTDYFNYSVGAALEHTVNGFPNMFTHWQYINKNIPQGGPNILLWMITASREKCNKN